MRELNINPNWTFRESVDNIKALKYQYKGILALFSYFDLKKKVEFRRNTRDSIYALKFEEWKKDKIWEYMNDFEEIELLEKLR